MAAAVATSPSRRFSDYLGATQASFILMRLPLFVLDEETYIAIYLWSEKVSLSDTDQHCTPLENFGDRM